MSDTVKPRDAKDVEAAVQWALAENKTFEIVGQGSKRGIGRAAQWDLSLDLSGLSGVTLYEPEELVLSARAGTPLAEIETLLADNGQELAFEPMDYGRLLGGVLTGEHGVGVEKRDLMPTMFTEIDLNQQQRVKCAFDAKGLLNPGKVFPQLHRCAELGRLHVHAGKLPFPDIPRF